LFVNGASFLKILKKAQEWVIQIAEKTVKYERTGYEDNNQAGTKNYKDNSQHPIFLSHFKQQYIRVHYIQTWAAIPRTPREYVHPGIVPGLDWASYQFSSIVYLPCLSWPTQQLVICPSDSYFTPAPSLNN
jgi:hypothetical protein